MLMLAHHLIGGISLHMANKSVISRQNCNLLYNWNVNLLINLESVQ